VVGTQIRELREELGVSQAALARAVRADQGHLSRVERGLAAASLDLLLALSANLGSDLSLRLFPTAGPRLRDHLQAPMVEALVRHLDRRWVARPEVPVPLARGVIDLTLSLRGEGFAVACEAHSELRSIELVLRRLSEKSLALGQVDGFGPATSSLLLLRSTARTRSLVRLHEATFAAAFPGRCRDALAALGGSGAGWPGSTLLWVRLEGRTAELLDTPPRMIRVGR
jgi:transcriptional regulator with XRE-family HTH domain